MNPTYSPNFGAQRRSRSGRWSPPLWGCYEYRNEYDDSDATGSSHSEDDDDSAGSDSETELDVKGSSSSGGVGTEVEGMDLGDNVARGSAMKMEDEDEAEMKAEIAREERRRRKEKRKGKQPERLLRQQKRERAREPVYRPILTIRRSEGFVWNQDLFVPSYIKDRYIASSPPNSSASSTMSTSASNTSFSGMDFEVECVEIRLDDADSTAGLIRKLRKGDA